MSPEGRRPSGLGSGFRALGQGRLLLLLSATAIVLALPAAFALWPALDAVFGHTLAGDHVLRNHPSFAPADVLEFLWEKRDAIAGARSAAAAMGLLGVLVQVLYAGGFVESLGRSRRAAVGDFFAGAFRNFWHNIKCLLIFALLAGIALGAWFGATGAASRQIFEDAVPGASSVLAWRIVVLAVGLYLFAVSSLLYDFARIARRHEPRIGAWRAFGFARRTLRGAWFRGLGLFLFWLIVGGTAWLSLIALEWGTAAVSVAAILVHTLLQISAVIVRSGVRLAAWGSFVALADGRTEDRYARSASVVDAPPEPPPVAVEPFPPLDGLGETPLA